MKKRTLERDSAVPRTTTCPPAVLPSIEAAEAAGLLYVRDDRPGFRRVARGKGFGYVDVDGRPVRDPVTLARIRDLVIPPAWTDVWICPSPRGHVQATGRDARGRKQHRYHARWRQTRDSTKYGRMFEFARALARIRARVRRDLGRPGLPREKVLATIVRLLDSVLVRVGNKEYAKQNSSFGLTTLRDRHAMFAGDSLRLEFRGKSGVRHAVDVRDRRVAQIVKACQELPGQELFQYQDDSGKRGTIDSGDVNAYLRETSGHDYTAKDFRTWAGTVLAAEALAAFTSSVSGAEARKNVVRAVRSVAERLGNTPSVCRSCYIHPIVIESYLNGSLPEILGRRPTASPRGLRREEAAVLVLLRPMREWKMGKETK